MVLLILAAACGAATEADSVSTTTTLSAGTAETTKPTETTAIVSENSTTTTETSTTTEPPPAETTTTSTPPPDPTSLVIDRFGVLGQWTRTEWDDMFPESVDQVPSANGETFRVVTLGDLPGTTTGGEPALVCDPTGGWGLNTTPQLDPGASGFSPIAVMATWDLQPREATILSPPPAAYTEVVASYLDSRGVTGVPVELLQVIKVDLEGDGVDEILIAAGYFEAGGLFGPSAATNDYSIVLLRKVIEGEVQTAVLHEFIGGVDAEGGPLAETFRVGGIADLNGDNTMEIVTNFGYYEGSGNIAWEYVDNDIGPVVVLSSGCCA